MPDRVWEFWIDVGGTFTDCFGLSPEGRLSSHKVLSSGVYKGEVLAGSTVDRLRISPPPGVPERFFEGFTLSLRHCPGADEKEGLPDYGSPDHYPGAIETGGSLDGVPPGQGVTVTAFEREGGWLHLERPLARPPMPGMLWELSSPLDAPVLGIRWLLGRRMAEPVGPVRVRLGMTLGTNALLERRGAKVALVTTAGFGDILRIAYQNRPKLFTLDIRKPEPLYAEVVEVVERVDAAGQVLQPLDESRARSDLASLREHGVDALAVCLLNSYRNPDHERRVATIAAALGFGQVSVSSALSSLQRVVPRGDTTVVDAYLTPVIKGYIRRLREQLPEAKLQLMTSAGGLIEAENFVGKDSIYSGPAGGAVGVASAAGAAGFTQAIGFDMGGTSTDVCRFDGGYEHRFEMELCAPGNESGVRIVAPMIAIETVAAGGGSICWFDGALLRVGPRSAGADPGPACYGRGGPLTITDVNLHLGRILPRRFPFPLDATAVEARLSEIQAAVTRSTSKALSLDELASGFVAVADQTMAAPIRKVSLEKGYDPRDYVLVSFGGAGAQHACRVAGELGIRRILQHPFASLLSAYGIGMAEVRLFDARDVGLVLGGQALARLETVFQELEGALRRRMAAEGVPSAQTAPPLRLLDLRYEGQDAVLTIPAPAGGDWTTAFTARHRQLYGFALEERRVEIRAARMELSSRRRQPAAPVAIPVPRPAEPVGTARTCFSDGWYEAPLYERERLSTGDWLDGPALVVESTTTVVVEPGWRAELMATGDLLLSRTGEQPPAIDAALKPGAACDPVNLALFNNRFAQIAEAMGVTLRKTALSVNVKERLDFSCALFNPAGELVVNAPHIPVHLGAMGATVQGLIRHVTDVQPGDVYVTNDPYLGGSHLPDVTVITPVFERSGRELIFFAANRAHHAEIGGVTPGSMPPFGRSLAEEGVLIRLFRYVRDNRADEEGLRRLLAGGPFPSRAVEDNLADIRAQAAANEAGRQRLLELVDRYGLEVTHAYMRHIQDAAEQKMRAALRKIAPGTYRFADQMDDGARIAVSVTVQHTERGGEAQLDFAGTAPVSAGNLNANPAIVRAAVLYALRCLVDEDVPLNDGFLRPVRIHIPADCLLNPRGGDDPARLPAVVAGNVETSQRVVDVIFGALGTVAASQGTMNNFLFGRPAGGEGRAFGYYETICGGAGAGPDFPGASAVHTHMTNTRITDPEVLEERYPVRLRRFAIRAGSGGRGAQPGGDGVIRELEFLAPLRLSLVTGRRATAPYGLAGGESGARGHNLLHRAGATTFEELGPMATTDVAAGDVLRLETPGGGGYGREPEASKKE